MKQLLRFSFVALLAMFCGSSFGQAIGPTVTFDFSDATNPWGLPTDKLEETGTFTYGDYTIVITTTNYTRWFDDTQALLIGKEGATLTLPAFDFDVERIEVVGHDGASGKVTHNIFVGDTPVSTEVTGAKSTSIFEIAADYQAAGNVYALKVTNANNDQIKQIHIWKKGSESGSGEEPGGETNYGTADAPLTVAEAIAIANATGTNATAEDVYTKGVVTEITTAWNSQYNNVSFNISDDGSTTKLAVFRCKADAEDYVLAGDEVIIKGKLKMYKETPEYDAGCEIVSLVQGEGHSGSGEVVHIENTAETAYTIAEAIELIDAGKSLEETVYVKGIVSKVDQYKDNYKSIDYWISDDGTTESAQFECYSGKGIDGADFESIDDIKVGATVIVKGKMKKYGETYEFDKNNELVSYEYAADTWTVAGTYPLVDNSWDPSDETADMTSTDGVTFTYVKEDVMLEKGVEYKFKVAKNHSWNEAYPGSDYVVTVDETAIYKVTITFNASTFEVGFEAEKTGSAGPVEHTYGVVGTLVGSWDNDVEMTKGDDGIYVAVISDVAAGDYEFKVRADKAWDINYPNNNYQLIVENDGSTVTVTFNEETKEVNATVEAATGISTAKIVNMNNAQIFNLAGQRVEKATKGIYIQNGKKYVVK